MCDKLFSVLANYYSGQTLILTFFSQKALLTKSQLRCFFYLLGKNIFLGMGTRSKEPVYCKIFFLFSHSEFPQCDKKILSLFKNPDKRGRQRNSFLRPKGLSHWAFNRHSILMWPHFVLRNIFVYCLVGSLLLLWLDVNKQLTLTKHQSKQR